MSSLRRTSVWPPPTWAAVPTPSFSFGTASTYNLAPFVSETSGLGYTLSVIGTLPTGVTLSGTSLVYSGGGTSGATANVQIRATNVGGSSDSAAFAVTLTAVGGPAPLLSAADFSYLGFYDLQTNGNDTPFGHGLAVRRVAGEVRLLHRHFLGNPQKGTIVEVSLAGRAFGTTINTVTRSWPLAGVSQIPNYEGYIFQIWWDDAASRLWVVSGIAYPQDVPPQLYPSRIFSCTLNDNGTISNARDLSLQNVVDRRVLSGILSIPPSMQSSLGLGPYGVGLGSYSSLMAASGETAMGLSLYAIPDPSAYSDGSQIPTSAWRLLATRGESPRGRKIWYGATFTPTGGTEPLAGLRFGFYTGKGNINYLDTGDPRQNPPTRPNFEVRPTAAWLSPSPQGDSYWTWDDRYVGGFFAPDGAPRRGLVCVGDFATGSSWYQSSATAHDGRTNEIHIFNPDHLAQVVQGTRSANSVEPVAMIPLPETDRPGTGNGQGPSAASAYDPIGNRLYVLKAQGGGTFVHRIYVYSVNV